MAAPGFEPRADQHRDGGSQGVRSQLLTYRAYKEVQRHVTEVKRTF